MMNIDKGFSIMVRMGLINEYDRTLKKHKFVLEESIDDIILEGIHRSYEIDDMVRILSKHYNIDLEDNFLETGSDIGIRVSGFLKSRTEFGSDEGLVASLIVNKDFPDKEKLRQFFKTCGWTQSEDDFVYDRNVDYIVMVFEKNKQEDAIDVGEHVYHLTPASKVLKIMKNGLAPRSGNKSGFRHIERVYVLLNKPGTIMAHNFATDLWRASLEQQTLDKNKLSVMLNSEMPPYALLEIDVRKCKDIKFYGDPNLIGGVWTLDNIPPQAITVLNNKI